MLLPYSESCRSLRLIGLVLQLASQLTECSKNLIGEAAPCLESPWPSSVFRSWAVLDSNWMSSLSCSSRRATV